jgi:hypothetical protein
MWSRKQKLCMRTYYGKKAWHKSLTVLCKIYSLQHCLQINISPWMFHELQPKLSILYSIGHFHYHFILNLIAPIFKLLINKCEF